MACSKQVTSSLVTAFLVLCAAIQAQVIRVGFHDGTFLEAGPGERITQGKLTAWTEEIDRGHWRVGFRNDGAPYWNLAKSWKPEHAQNAHVKGILVAVPQGWSVDWAPERGAKSLGFKFRGMDLWSLWWEGSPAPIDPNDAQSTRYMQITGGEQIYWDVTERHRVAPQIQSIDKIKRVLEISDLGDWPRVARLRSLFRFSVESFSYGKGYSGRGNPNADMGWWLVNFWKRFAPSWKPSMGDPIRWGQVPWAEGFSSGHYAPEVSAIAQWVRTGDAGAWRLADLLVRTKISSGFAGSGSTYEKTSGDAVADWTAVKQGISRWPELSHTWMLGAGLYAEATGDPQARDAWNRWLAYLHTLTGAQVWNGRNGSRFGAWPLRDLRAAFILTGDSKHLLKAESWIRHFVSVATTHLPGDPPVRYPWQEALLVSSMLQWVDLGACLDLKARIESLGRAAIARGLTITTIAGVEYARPAMQTDYPGVADIVQAPNLACEYLDCVRRVMPGSREHLACRRTAAGLLFTDWAHADKPVFPGDDCFDGAVNAMANEKVYSNAALLLTDEVLK